MLLILTFSATVFGQTASVKIYFSNDKLQRNQNSCSEVFPVVRKIPKTKAVANAALRELFRGATGRETAKGYSSLFSNKTKNILISVKIKNKAAYVNFKDDIEQSLGNATSSCGSQSFTAQIKKTLKQFPTIKKVFYAIEGKPKDFYDWIQIGECPPELKNCSGKDF